METPAEVKSLGTRELVVPRVSRTPIDTATSDSVGKVVSTTEHLVIGIDPGDGKGKTADHFLVPNPNLGVFLSRPEVQATIEEVETARESNIYGINNWPLPITHQSFDLDIKTLEICRKDIEEYLNSLQRFLMPWSTKPIRCETGRDLYELVAAAKEITQQKEDADERLRNFLREYFKKETPDLNFSERVTTWSSRLKVPVGAVIHTLYAKPPVPFPDWFYEAVREYFEPMLKEKPDDCGVRK